MILVPFDFSSGSRLALRYAAPLARRLGAKITLIYVDPIPHLAARLRTKPPMPADREADAAISRELAELAAPEIGPAFQVDAVVRRGGMGEEIVKAARELRSDLILMPAHGHAEQQQQTPLGITAEHVVHHASCPVCTIRAEAVPKSAEPASGSMNWRHIVVPVDFSECSRQAVQLAGMVAKQAGGRLTLFHVVELNEAHTSNARLHLPQAHARLRLDAKQKLQAWIEAEVPSMVPVTTLVRIGVPSPELIVRGIRLLGGDLIVMGKHEDSWMRRLAQGGEIDQLARLTPCPVISVHPDREDHP